MGLIVSLFYYLFIYLFLNVSSYTELAYFEIFIYISLIYRYNIENSQCLHKYKYTENVKSKYFPYFYESFGNPG